MRHYVIYDKDSGAILLRVKSNGSPPDGSASLTEDEANLIPPVESTHVVDVETGRLKRKPDVRGVPFAVN